MIHPTVKNSVTYLIVPFSFEKNYLEVLDTINADYFKKEDINTERLFEHIEKLVTSQKDNPETIGTHFKMKQRARSKFHLPNKSDLMLTLKTKYEEYQFCLPSVELYLFETQVGFWILKLGYPEGINMERLIETNYYAKKLQHYEYDLYYTKKVSIDKSIQQSVHIGEMIKELSKDFEVSSFFEGSLENPNQALVYNSVSLNSLLKDTEHSLIASYLFQLRRSFKSTYKPSDSEKDLLGNPNLLPLFHNSYWGISLEGLANIVTTTDDPKTEEFFSSTYIYQLETTYFYIYILALHQKYALLKISILASKLSYDLNKVGEDYKEQNRLITELRNQITRFMLRSSYKQISNNTHYSQLYEVIRENLKINELFKELHDELNAISSITEVAEQKQLHQEEKQKREQAELFNNKITNITTFFLPISVITGFFGMNLTFIEDHGEDWWLFIAFTLIFYIVTYFMKKK